MSAAALKPALLAGLHELGLNLSDTQVDQLLAYQDLIGKWNKVYNLTAVRDPQEMLTHHLLDSLAAIPPLLRQTGGRPGFAAGPPQGETAPSGGSDPRSGGAWGQQRLAAGPPQGETAPSGGSDPRSGGAWGPPDRSEGPPRARSAPSGGSDPRSGGAWGQQRLAAGPPQGETTPGPGEDRDPSRSWGSDPRSGGAWGPPDRSEGPPRARSAPSGGSDPRSGGAWGPPHLHLLDVGSGGGLPGVVIAITCPQIEVHCVDTVLKKATFIQQVAATLKLPNLRGIHARVESLKAEQEGQEGQGGGYDVVCSRAFASLVDFTTWSRSALRTGAVWMAMKGKHPVDELAALPPEVSVFHVEQLVVPGLEAERCIVWMRLTD